MKQGSLTAAPAPLGVFPEFTRHTAPIALKVRERKLSFTGDDFAVKDAVTGAVVFDVQAKALSLHQTKIVKTHQNQPLFEIKRVTMSFPKKYQGLRVGGNNEVLFEVQGHSFMGTKLDISFRNLAGDGRQTMFQLQGDWFKHGATIKAQDGTVVADISKEYANAGQLLCKYPFYRCLPDQCTQLPLLDSWTADVHCDHCSQCRRGPHHGYLRSPGREGFGQVSLICARQICDRSSHGISSCQYGASVKRARVREERVCAACFRSA